jgi:hypothetical protein
MDGTGTTAFVMLRREVRLTATHDYLTVGFNNYWLTRLFGLNHAPSTQRLPYGIEVIGCLQRMQGLEGRCASWWKITPRNRKLREIKQKKPEVQPGSKAVPWEVYVQQRAAARKKRPTRRRSKTT